jgi:radical SAM protein with 4Fe4S-binding SPASM domain
LRIRDYLNTGADRIEQIKATATFPQTAESCSRELTLSFPPFEESIVKHIVSQQSDVKQKARAYPAIVQIQLPSISDCHNICSRSYAESQRPGTCVDSQGFTRLIDDLLRLKAKWVDFSGGEPTLCPEFRRLTRSCVDKRLRVKLLTDAGWHDDKMVGFVVEVFSFVGVNLDAGSQQVYDRIHHTEWGEFQSVLRNVEKMIRYREQQKSHLVIGAEVNLTQANMNFTEEIAALARDLRLDYVRFRAGQTTHDSLLPEQRETTEVLLRELKDVLHHFPVYWQISSSKPVSGCRMSRFQLVVDASGDLHTCPEFSLLPQLRSFGNIHDKPLNELWLCPEHRKTLIELDESPCPVSDCPWRGCNRFLPEIHV